MWVYKGTILISENILTLVGYLIFFKIFILVFFFKLSILPNSVYFDVRHKFGWNQSIKQTKHDYLWQVEFVRAGKCGYSQPTFVQFSFYFSTYNKISFYLLWILPIHKNKSSAKAEKHNISNVVKRVWIKTKQYKCFVARAIITTIGLGWVGQTGTKQYERQKYENTFISLNW